MPGHPKMRTCILTTWLRSWPPRLRRSFPLQGWTLSNQQLIKRTELDAVLSLSGKKSTTPIACWRRPSQSGWGLTSVPPASPTPMPSSLPLPLIITHSGRSALPESPSPRAPKRRSLNTEDAPLPLLSNLQWITPSLALMRRGSGPGTHQSH